MHTLEQPSHYEYSVVRQNTQTNQKKLTKQELQGLEAGGLGDCA